MQKESKIIDSCSPKHSYYKLSVTTLFLFANDKAENEVIKTVSFYVDHDIIDSEIPIIEEKQPADQNYLLVIGIIIGATIGVISVLLATNKIKIQEHK